MAKSVKLKKIYLKGDYEDRDIISLINSAFFKDIKSIKIGLFLGTGKYVQSLLKQKDLSKEEIIQICKNCYNPDVDLALKIIELRPDYIYHVKMIQSKLGLNPSDKESDLFNKLKNKKKLLDMIGE